MERTKFIGSIDLFKDLTENEIIQMNCIVEEKKFKKQKVNKDLICV